jgi:hypothetical protein
MATEDTPETEGGEKLTMERLGQVTAYGHQLNELLKSLGAKVEAYKFAVEKKDETLIIGVAIRASLPPQGRGRHLRAAVESSQMQAARNMWKAALACEHQALLPQIPGAHQRPAGRPLRRR